MKVIRPFGPSIAKVSIPENLTKDLNNYLNQIISSDEKIKLQNHGDKLAGNVSQEFKLEKGFINSCGLENFLTMNAKEWIKQTVNKEINKSAERRSISFNALIDDEIYGSIGKAKND